MQDPIRRNNYFGSISIIKRDFMMVDGPVTATGRHDKNEAIDTHECGDAFSRAHKSECVADGG